MIKKQLFGVGILSLVLMTFGLLTTRDVTHYLKGTITQVGSTCTSDDPLLDSIQDVIDNYPGCDRLELAAGTYDVSGGQVDVSRDITIVGVGNGSDPSSNSIVDAGGSGRAFNVSIFGGGTVVFENFRIMDGSFLNGGGILNTGVDLTLDNIVLTNNVASGSLGGGIYQQGAGASLTVRNNSEISSNDADNGGGLYISAGTLLVQDSVITGNNADDTSGGGIHFDGTTITLSNVDINNNYADSQGGGVYVGSGNLTIDSGTIFNANNTDASGAGLYFQSSGTANLDNVTVQNNISTGDGGGITHTGTGSMTIVDSTIDNNESNAEGGGINSSGSFLIIQRSTIINNDSLTDGGGGIHVFSTSFALEDSEVESNTANTNGGGMLLGGDFASVERSLIKDNMVNGSGGGIMNQSGISLYVANTTIVGNDGPGDGGGILHSGAALEILNATIVNNTTTSDGGGIHDLVGNIATIENSILYGNTSGDPSSFDIFGALTRGYNIIGQDPSGSGLAEETPGDALNDQYQIDPLLDVLTMDGGEVRVIPLLVGSPAINAGNLAVCPADDQRQQSRPFDGGCDIGAYEYAVVAAAVVTVPAGDPETPSGRTGVRGHFRCATRETYKYLTRPREIGEPIEEYLDRLNARGKYAIEEKQVVYTTRNGEEKVLSRCVPNKVRQPSQRYVSYLGSRESRVGITNKHNYERMAYTSAAKNVASTHQALQKIRRTSSGPQGVARPSYRSRGVPRTAQRLDAGAQVARLREAQKINIYEGYKPYDFARNGEVEIREIPVE